MSIIEEKDKEINEAKEIVEVYIKNGIKHVVWDFDLTVLGLHSADIVLKISSDLMTARWNDAKCDSIGPCNLNYYANANLFKDVVLECKRNNIKVYIASFGYRLFIKGQIEILFGKDQDIFNDDNVWTPSDFGFNDFDDMGDKLKMLNKIKLDNGDKNQVLFYDDSYKNITSAVADGFKHAFLVNNRFNDVGLTSKEKYLSC